jgi:hypothetical protein
LIVETPAWKREEAENMVKLAGKSMYEKYALVDGARWCSEEDLVQ